MDSPFANTHVLLIGISAYKSKDIARRLGKIDCAHSDVINLAQTLYNIGYNGSYVHPLYNEQATKRSIRDKLADLREQLDKRRGDFVWVFWAGHGHYDTKNGCSYLLPYDASLHRLDVTAYKLQTFAANLADLNVNHAAAFVDACCSKLPTAKHVLRPIQFGEFLARESVRAFVGIQIALETDYIGGILATCLREGIEGKGYPDDENGIVDLLSIKLHLQRATIKRAIEALLRGGYSLSNLRKPSIDYSGEEIVPIGLDLPRYLHGPLNGLPESAREFAQQVIRKRWSDKS